MTQTKHQLAAQKRQLTGRKVKSLRRQGIIPANIFGKNINSQAIQVDQKIFQHTYDQAGETGLIQLTIEGEAPKPVLVSATQTNPVSGQLLHIDFHQVDLKEKVHAMVPVVVIGESTAVKELGAVMLTLLNEIPVEALPTDIPSQFEVDVTKLTAFNDAVYVKDLIGDNQKISIQLNPDDMVVVVQEPKTQEEPEESAIPTEGESDEKAQESNQNNNSTEDKSAE